jgi:hypothetical protein
MAVWPGALLVLLDMNGTLLFRARRELECRRADIKHDVFHYFFRPYAQELVLWLLQHPRARVAFYTSMRMSNALPAVAHLLKAETPLAPGLEHLGLEPYVYDREFTAPDPEGQHSWSTKRDLDRVWSANMKVTMNHSVAVLGITHSLVALWSGAGSLLLPVSPF